MINIIDYINTNIFKKTKYPCEIVFTTSNIVDLTHWVTVVFRCVLPAQHNIPPQVRGEHLPTFKLTKGCSGKETHPLEDCTLIVDNKWTINFVDVIDLVNAIDNVMSIAIDKHFKKYIKQSNKTNKREIVMCSKSLTMSAFKKCVETILEDKAKYMFVIGRKNTTGGDILTVIPRKEVLESYDYYKEILSYDLEADDWRVIRFGHTNDLRELEQYI